MMPTAIGVIDSAACDGVRPMPPAGTARYSEMTYIGPLTTAK
ncbi:hypothetical protein ACRJ4B_26615 [Streptomyces sp. GTA36]